METDLNNSLTHALHAAATKLGYTGEAVVLERPRDPAHGDFASSLAMRLAKELKTNPRELATNLASAINDHPAVAKVEVAGPGFVNIYLTKAAAAAVVSDALAKQGSFAPQPATAENYLLEFVSANPTGPLHIGHGRAAAHGDALARILRFSGAAVTTEYYLNDRGLQTEILAASLWLRVLEQRGDLAIDPWPVGAYAGEYLVDLAKEFTEAPPTPSSQLVLTELPEAADDNAKQLVEVVKQSLDDADFARVREFAIAAMTKQIQAELASCRVSMDNWQSEAALAASGAIEQALKDFTAKELLYEQDGATWFCSAKFGDEKDRVVIRANGEQTYFAADIAYHIDKLKRCEGILYNLLGADHHGYIGRLQAVLAASGHDPQRLEIGMLQLVSLKNAGDRIKMSTRAGKYYLLSDLVAALGADAVRLGFVLSRIDAAMEFDVKKAATANNENPVYYIQYAHARSCSLLAKWGGDVASLSVDPTAYCAAATPVMTELRWFGDTLATAVRERAPHRIAHWLIALASTLHSYYDKVPVLGGDAAGRESRLALVAATRNALATGLELLGVSAPTKM